MAKTIAVIPARGGSKGIPGKNLRKVGGLPLVARAVYAARAASRIDAVFVSSDDQAILECGERYGATGLDRPANIAGDEASSESALLDVLDRREVAGLAPERLVMIQCTSPFTTAEELDALVAALDDDRFSAALTVVADHGFLWTVDEDGRGRGINHDPDEPRRRRQDLSPQYRETGAAYAMKVDAFRKSGARFCGSVLPVETRHPPFEIDSPDDLAIARALAASRDDNSLRAQAFRDIRALVTDFDGVHTDDGVAVCEDGKETVRCSRSDGLGIERLRATGLPIFILSKETNPVVRRRADKLKVPVIHGADDKLSVLREWADKEGIGLDATCYVGNDVNDIECLAAAGLAVAPADARREVVAAADIVLQRKGGDGAVREVCELILAAQAENEADAA